MRLIDLLPKGVTTDEDVVYDAITQWVDHRGLTLYPAQDEAILECVAGSNVILATPTGSGKSLVATGAMAAALARGECSVYTAPIKALVSEKFFDLCEIFGADNVGMVTGDAAVNADAPIIAATAEILANMALREGAGADIGLVVMDEFHFYADPDRGWAWQVPLIELPKAQFLLMSATLGDTTRFEADLSRRTGRSTALVTTSERPVPLISEYVFDADPGDARAADRDASDARVRRALHPGLGARAGSGAHQHQGRHPRGDATSLPSTSATSGSPRHSARRCRGSSAWASACTMPGCCRAIAGSSRR